MDAKQYQDEAVQPFKAFLEENNYHLERPIFMQGILSIGYTILLRIG